MPQKLWEKSVQVDRDVERFTVGKDREMDLYLAPFDILGSLAHISMLQSIGLLTAEELKQLTEELRNIYRDTETGKFLIEEGVEDVHSQVELLLTRKLGDIGKKIHSGRSRNDQVLVDLKLFTRSRLQNIVKKTEKLFDTLIAQSENTNKYSCRGTPICKSLCPPLSDYGSPPMPKVWQTTSSSCKPPTGCATAIR